MDLKGAGSGRTDYIIRLDGEEFINKGALFGDSGLHILPGRMPRTVPTTL